MSSFKSHPFKRFRRFGKSEEGSSSVEFVILFPLVFGLFLMSAEIAIMMARSLMLDRAVDVSVRSLRLGSLTPMTHDGLKEDICNNSLIIPDCVNSLSVELIPIDVSTTDARQKQVQCADKSEDVKPVLEFQAGSANEMMLVATCATFTPYFPTTGLAAQIKLDGAGEYALVATSAFVNEP